MAEPYPRGLAKLLATALCAHAGWCDQKQLNVSGCCRASSMRIGEAKNPGPMPFARSDRPTLELLPGVSASTLGDGSTAAGRVSQVVQSVLENYRCWLPF